MGSPNPSLDAIVNGTVTGVTNNGTDGFPRLEIDDFCQDSARLNLYLLALEAVQKNDKAFSDPWCWFQIQGIHGVPDIAWDNVQSSSLYDWITAQSRPWEAKDYSLDGLTPIPKPWKNLDSIDPATHPSIVPKTGNPASGYCNHGSVLFPSWHRGYCAMIEQAVQSQMVIIADQFPAAHPLFLPSRRAAQSFRQPYWDFLRARAGSTAKGSLQYGLSMILAVKNVKVRRPGAPNSPVIIPNPLYSYTFPVGRYPSGEVNANGFHGLRATLTNTSRHPIPGTATSRNPDIANTFNVNETGGAAGDVDIVGPSGFLINALRARVYKTLSVPQIYSSYATTAFLNATDLTSGDATFEDTTLFPDPFNSPKNPSTRYSLEAWHNEIHGIVGGPFQEGGTMSAVELAGFDPIFPLHHGNVDRHYALWQALWPGSWWTPGVMSATQNNYTTKIGTRETPKTPLFPFRKPDSSGKPAGFWNANDLRYPASLGYQIDPITSNSVVALSGPDADARKTAATTEMNVKYSWFKTPDAANAGIIDPVPMDKVEAFTEFPPFFDGSTVKVNLWNPTAPVPFVAHARAGAGGLPAPALTSAASVSEGNELSPSQVKDNVVIQEKVTTLQAGSSTEPPPKEKVLPTPMPLHGNTIFPTSAILPGNRIKEWTLHVTALRHGLGTAFTIFIFLGPFPSSPTLWPTAPTLISALHQFVNHNPSAFETPHPPSGEYLRVKESRQLHPTCANCAAQEAEKVLVGDFAPLTGALVWYLRSGRAVPDKDRGEIAEGEPKGVALRSLDEDDVVPFLQRNLHWRVLRSDGFEVPRDEVPEFKVYTVEEIMKLPERDDEMPIYEEMKLQFEVTNGRAGGLNRGELVGGRLTGNTE